MTATVKKAEPPSLAAGWWYWKARADQGGPFRAVAEAQRDAARRGFKTREK